MITEKKHYPNGQHPNQIEHRRKRLERLKSFQAKRDEIKRMKRNARAKDYRDRLKAVLFEGEAKPRIVTGGYTKLADRTEAQEQKEPQ